MTAIAKRLFPRTMAILALACCGSVSAQMYPSKPVRWIVPYAAGGGTDIIARVLAAEMTTNLGQQVLVENRAGAGTIIGAEAAAKSPADGYTLLSADNGTLIFNPFMYKKLPYDPIRDFAPVSTIVKFSLMLMVNPQVNSATTVAELVAMAKAQPGKINYASPGAGSPHHLAMELFRERTGTVFQHVPYKGSAPLMQDLLGGQIGVTMSGIATGLQHVRSGKLRALAVGERKRIETLPDVPTFAEAGVPGVVAYAWQGVLVPAGTPRDIVARLNQDLLRSIKAPEVLKRFAAVGAEPLSSTPEEFASLIRDDTDIWGKVIRARGISLDK